MNSNDKTKIIDAFNKHIMTLEDDEITHKIKNKLMVSFSDVVEKTFPSKKNFMQRLMGE